MTKEDFEAITAVVKAAVRKTPVQIYASDGKLVSFFIEDILSLEPSCDITKKRCCIYVDGFKEPIVVLGSYSYWKKLLNYDPKILNDFED